MIVLIINFIVYGIMFWGIDHYLPSMLFGFHVINGDNWLGYIFLGGIFYMIQKIIKPIINFLAIPINIFTLGFAGVLVNIGMLYILQYIINNIGIMTISIGNIVQIFLLSILLSFVYKIIDMILSVIKTKE